MTERSGWMTIVDDDPDHSQRYIQRFRDLAARGADLGGEARLVDSLAPRSARVLDAGCGTGRVGAIVHAAGHEVIGVDGDPALIEAARADHPGPTWIVGDLAELDLAAAGVVSAFDVIVCAGNVMAFLAPTTRITVLEHLRRHLDPNGRLAVGFGRDRGYEFDDFLRDVAAAGLAIDHLAATWDLRPFRDDAEFLVAILSAPTR